MSNEPLPRESFAVVANDHELLSAYGERFGKLLAAESPAYVEKTITDIQVLLNQKLADHFALEEEQVFPALLAANPGEGTRRLVSELQEDHKALLQEVSRLNRMLGDQRLVRSRANELRQVMVDFFMTLQRHAAQEDELFRASSRGGA